MTTRSVFPPERLRASSPAPRQPRCSRAAAIRPPAAVTLATALTALLVSGCGGNSGGSLQSPASPAATPKQTGTPASTALGPAPAGYRWVGSTAQGVRFAIPRDWAAVNLAKVSLGNAIRQFAPRGLSVAYLKTVLTKLSQSRGVFVMDLASVAHSAHNFGSNVNAFCQRTGLVPSKAEVPSLESAIRAQYARLHAHILGIGSTTIGGDLAIKAGFTLTAAGGTSVSEIQYSVFSPGGRGCFVTMTTDNMPSLQHVFGTIAGTIHVS